MSEQVHKSAMGPIEWIGSEQFSPLVDVERLAPAKMSDTALWSTLQNAAYKSSGNPIYAGPAPEWWAGDKSRMVGDSHMVVRDPRGTLAASLFSRAIKSVSSVPESTEEWCRDSRGTGWGELPKVGNIGSDDSHAWEPIGFQQHAGMVASYELTSGERVARLSTATTHPTSSEAYLSWSFLTLLAHVADKMADGREIGAGCELFATHKPTAGAASMLRVYVRWVPRSHTRQDAGKWETVKSAAKTEIVGLVMPIRTSAAR